jgi:hypothetical protein
MGRRKSLKVIERWRKFFSVSNPPFWLGLERVFKA